MTKEHTLTSLSLTNDAAFKSIVRNPNLQEIMARYLHLVTHIPLNDLLNASFEAGEQIKLALENKGMTTDVLIKVHDKLFIILECNTYDCIERNVGYVYRVLDANTLINDDTYPKVILVNFNSFNVFGKNDIYEEFLIQTDEQLVESDSYKSVHIMLANLEKNKYNISEEERNFLELFTTTWTKEKIKDYRKNGDERYMKVIDTIEEYMQSPEYAAWYDKEEREKQNRILAERAGIKQGIKEKALDVARNMLKKKESITKIQEYTELSIEEIEALN